MTLGRQIDGMDERSTLVPLLLGVQNILDDFARQVETERNGSQTNPVPDHRLLFAALGALSLRRTLGRWLAHAAGQDPGDVGRAARPVGPGDADKDLLR